MLKLIKHLIGRHHRQSEKKHRDRPVDAVLRAHPSVFQVTCTAFEHTLDMELECGLFWYGTTLDATATVTAIVIPDQRCHPGHYHVSGEAIEAVSDHTRSKGWHNLAQVHTHPGNRVDHSIYDSEQAISRHALSLVFPYYGAPFENWSRSVGIHEFIAGEWRRLSSQRSRERIRLDSSLPVPETIDLRTAP